MTAINNQLHGLVSKATGTPQAQAAIGQLRERSHDGITSREMIEAAYAATRDAYVRSGKTVDEATLRQDAYLNAAAEAMEKPYQLADAPAGSDKTAHFFMSGYLAARVDAALAKVWVPKGAREAIATQATIALGVLKEVADVFTTGFSREDLAADVAGAKSPFQPR